MVKSLAADTSSQLNLLKVGRDSRCLTILLMSVSLEIRRMVSYLVIFPPKHSPSVPNV